MHLSQTIPFPIPSQVPHTFTDATHYAQQCLKTAWKDLREVKKAAFPHRLHFLQERINTYEDNGETLKADSVRAILSKETRRHMFKKLSFHINGSSADSLHKVIVTHHGEPTEITDTSALHSALLNRNRHHFRQAHETPFAQPPLSDILPPLDYTDTVEAILRGDLLFFTNLPPETRSFLSNMKSTPSELFSETISLEDFTIGMKKATEGKSSSCVWSTLWDLQSTSPQCPFQRSGRSAHQSWSR